MTCAKLLLNSRFATFLSILTKKDTTVRLGDTKLVSRKKGSDELSSRTQKSDSDMGKYSGGKNSESKSKNSGKSSETEST